MNYVAWQAEAAERMRVARERRRALERELQLSSAEPKLDLSEVDDLVQAGEKP